MDFDACQPEVTLVNDIGQWCSRKNYIITCYFPRSEQQIAIKPYGYDELKLLDCETIYEVSNAAILFTELQTNSNNTKEWQSLQIDCWVFVNYI